MTLTPGQTWRTNTTSRTVVTALTNAHGTRLVGYVHPHGTALATEAEFADWIARAGAGLSATVRTTLRAPHEHGWVRVQLLDRPGVEAWEMPDGTIYHCRVGFRPTVVE